MSLEVPDVDKILSTPISISNYLFRDNGFNALMNGACQSLTFFYKTATTVLESLSQTTREISPKWSYVYDEGLGLRILEMKPDLEAFRKARNALRDLYE